MDGYISGLEENVYNFEFVTVPEYKDGFFLALVFSKKSSGSYIRFVRIPFIESPHKDEVETQPLKESLETVVFDDFKVTATVVDKILQRDDIIFYYSGISRNP